jgi:hypothetical protein
MAGRKLKPSDVAILEDLLPLRGGFVGEEVVFIPEEVSSRTNRKIE